MQDARLDEPPLGGSPPVESDDNEDETDIDAVEDIAQRTLRVHCRRRRTQVDKLLEPLKAEDDLGSKALKRKSLMDYKYEGWNVLMIAASHGEIEVLEKLVLAHKTEDVLDRPDPEQGRTPLLIAAGCGHDAVVAWLLAKSAQVDHQDARGHTALSIAARYGHVEVTHIAASWISYVVLCSFRIDI